MTPRSRLGGRQRRGALYHCRSPHDGPPSRPLAFSCFRTRITTCVILIELRQALISYQDYQMCYPDRVETGPYFGPGLPHVLS